MSAVLSARSRPRNQFALRRTLAVFISLVLAVALVPFTASIASAASDELLANADFSDGLNGWRTNGESQVATQLDDGVVQLTTSVPGNVVLNDEPNTVRSTAVGATYIASARVRTLTPEVGGELRIREVSGDQVTTSRTPFTLADTAWHDVTLQVTTAYKQSHLDFNLVAADLAVGSSLQVQATSVKLASTPAAPPAAEADATPVTAAPEVAAPVADPAEVAPMAFAAPMAAAAATTGSELLTNPNFVDGTAGWSTNSTNETLRILSGDIAQLTTSRAGNATLNDQPNAVRSAAKGSTYLVSARVRTTTPEVKGALRIREVTGSQATSSQTSFTLSSTTWTTVELSVTTARAGSQLDFNLVAWNLPAGKNLQIDWVSLKAVGAAAAPPVSNPVPAPPPAAQCDVAPPQGTIFGTNLSLINQTAPEAIKKLDSTFGRVGVIRQFDSGLPLSWSSRKAELLKGRTLVTSFKAPPSEIASGKHDAFFRNWFKAAPTDQTIYWSYYHEPENNINKGEFTTAQYRAAWTRLANIAKEACKPNMHATLILTGWTMNASSKRDYRVYDAGPEYVKVLAFDPYNGIYEDRDYYEAPESMFGHIVTKMKADGRPWGIAETGAVLVKNDPSGSKRAAWLTSMGPYLVRNGALFVTYFNSVEPKGDYRLLDAASIKAWSALVKG